MLCIAKSTLIHPGLHREKILGLTFKVTDFIEGDVVFLKDSEGNTYNLSVKEGKLQILMDETADERIGYLEDMVVTLLEQLNMKEEDMHDLTFKRLYGDES
jgi:hypothetical protein